MKKSVIILILVVVLTAIVGWFFFTKKQTTKTTEEVKLETQSTSFGGAVSEGVGDVQPLEKIPNINVFNSVETNPYKSGYTNPFSK